MIQKCTRASSYSLGIYLKLCVSANLSPNLISDVVYPRPNCLFSRLTEDGTTVCLLCESGTDLKLNVLATCHAQEIMDCANLTVFVPSHSSDYCIGLPSIIFTAWTIIFVFLVIQNIIMETIYCSWPTRMTLPSG